MSGLDELQKGLSIFNDSVQRFVTTNALSNASMQLDNINEQVYKNEAEKQQAKQIVSDKLAMGLAQAGVPATTIEQTAGRFGIGADRQSMLTEAQRSEASQQSFNAVENAKDRQLKRDLAKSSLEVQFGKNGTRLSTQTASRLERARKSFLNVGKKSIEAAGQAQTALQLLTSGNPVADNGIGTFMARASSEVGNLTEAEREMFLGSKSVPRWATRVIQRWASGNLANADRRDLIKLATTMKKAAEHRLNEYAKNEMDSVKTIIKVSGDSIDDKALSDAIFPRSDLTPTTTPGSMSTDANSSSSGNGGAPDFMKFLRDK